MQIDLSLCHDHQFFSPILQTSEKTQSLVLPHILSLPKALGRVWSSVINKNPIFLPNKDYVYIPVGRGAGDPSLHKTGWKYFEIQSTSLLDWLSPNAGSHKHLFA